MSYKERLLREYVRRMLICERLEPGAKLTPEEDHPMGLWTYEEIHGQRRASLFGKGVFHKIAWFLNMPQSGGDLLSMPIVYGPLLALAGYHAAQEMLPEDLDAALPDIPEVQDVIDAVESETIPDATTSAGGWLGQTFPNLATSFENVSSTIMSPDLGIGERISAVTDELGDIESNLATDIESGIEGVTGEIESGIGELMSGEDTVPPAEVLAPEPVVIPPEPDVVSDEFDDDDTTLDERLRYCRSSLSVSRLLFEGDDIVGEEILSGLRFDIERLRDVVDKVSLSNNIVDSMKIFHRLTGLKPGDYEKIEAAIEAARGKFDPQKLNDFFVDVTVPDLLRQNVDLMINSILNSPQDSPFNRLDYSVKSSVIEQLEGLRTYLQTS